MDGRTEPADREEMRKVRELRLRRPVFPTLCMSTQSGMKSLGIRDCRWISMLSAPSGAHYLRTLTSARHDWRRCVC